MGVRSVAGGDPRHVIGIELASAAGTPDEVAWYLGIESAWRLESATEILTCWQDADAASERMRVELQALGGAVVTEMNVVAPAFDLDFRFADGKRLIVFADTRDETRSCWYLLDPEQRAVNAGPAGRLDFEAD